MLVKQLKKKFGTKYIVILSQKMQIDKAILSTQLDGSSEMEGYVKYRLHVIMGVYLYELENMLKLQTQVYQAIKENY